MQSFLFAKVNSKQYFKFIVKCITVFFRFQEKVRSSPSKFKNLKLLPKKNLCAAVLINAKTFSQVILNKYMLSKQNTRPHHRIPKV